MFLSCHAYAFQSESTLYSYLNVKELLARNRHDIWSPNDCNGTRIHKHLVCKRSNGCGFTLSIDFRVWIHSEMRMCDMIRTYSQMHLTDKYLQHSSIIWPVWLNGWVFLYKLVGCGFNPRYIYLNVRYRACFEQGVFWHSGNYRVWIHSEKVRDIIRTYSSKIRNFDFTFVVVVVAVVVLLFFWEGFFFTLGVHLKVSHAWENIPAAAGKFKY